MVLWSSLGEELRGGFVENADARSGRSAGLSKESAGEASNLMRRPVQRGSRNATTSACVGWDLINIENRPAFRKRASNAYIGHVHVKTASPPPESRSRSSEWSVPH